MNRRWSAAKLFDYVATLAALLLAALLGRSYRLATASICIAANWCICTAIADRVFPNPPGFYGYPAAAFAAADYGSALTLLVLIPLISERLPSFTHKVVAAIWGVQLVWHAYYICSPRTALLDWQSWHFLSKTSWLQLAVIAGDGIFNILYRHGLFDRGARHFNTLFQRTRGR